MQVQTVYLILKKISLLLWLYSLLFVDNLRGLFELK